MSQGAAIAILLMFTVVLVHWLLHKHLEYKYSRRDSKSAADQRTDRREL